MAMVCRCSSSVLLSVVVSDHASARALGVGAGPGSAVTLLRRHPPDAVIVAAAAVELDSAQGLAGCLAGDPEGSTYLGVGGSLAAGCGGQQVNRVQDRISGVSRVLEVSQRLLRAGQGGLERSHGRGDPPPGVSALGRAHGNRSCHRKTGVRQAARQPRFTPQECIEKGANWSKQSNSEMKGSGAPDRARSLISSYIFQRTGPQGSGGPAKAGMKDPRAVAAAGGRITKAVE